MTTDLSSDTTKTTSETGGETMMIRWGIMSTATIATKVYLAMADACNATVVAVASRSLDKAEAWAKERGIPRAYGSYEELLDDETLDAIYIPLPTALKKEWAIRAAQSGKHVLCEKPLPESLEDLKAMQQACREANVVFMDGTMWLHSYRTTQVQRQLPELGKIWRLNASFTFPAPDEEWLNGGNGRTNPEREPQGCLECGWYPLSAILMARQYKLPQRVQCVSAIRNKIGAMVACGAVMWWDDGVWATFDCGYTAAHRCALEISAANGTLTIDDVCGGQGKSGNFDAYATNFTGSERYMLDSPLGKETVIASVPCNHTQRMIERFDELVRQNKGLKPLEEVPDAAHWCDVTLKTQQLLNAVFKSYEKDNAVVELAEDLA